MNVDEARRDDEAFSIENLSVGGFDLARIFDGDNPAVAQQQIAWAVEAGGRDR